MAVTIDSLKGHIGKTIANARTEEALMMAVVDLIVNGSSFGKTRNRLLEKALKKAIRHGWMKVKCRIITEVCGVGGDALKPSFGDILPLFINATTEGQLSSKLELYPQFRMVLTIEERGALLAVAKDIAKHHGWDRVVQQVVDLHTVEKAEIEGAVPVE